MKKSFVIPLFIFCSLIMASCVTKQKYLELEDKYKKCTSDLNYTSNEKMEFQGKTKELTQEVKQLNDRVNDLKKDTLQLSKKLQDSERNLVKMKMDYNELMNSFTNLNKNANNELSTLLMHIDSIKHQLSLKEIELNEKETRLLELQTILRQKDEEVEALKNKVADALKGFLDKGLNVYERNGKVYVSMEEKLLFASGSWVVGNRGIEAIQELAKILEADSSINILIEGHTDDVPYKGSAQIKDNWDLSVMRATSVVKALLKDTQINPQRISAAGRSEYLPINQNDTPEMRAKNRRTEIILTPKLDELFKIIENN